MEKPRDKNTILQELLVLRCQRGEKQAFDDLIRLWEDRLFYYVRRLTASEEDAWDALQQTWIKVFKGIRLLREPERLPAWLYRTARCAAMSHWRSLRRAQDHLEEGDVANEFFASEENDRFDDAEEVHRGMSLLSVAHREALTLFFLEDLSLDEMAEVLEISPGTVKSRLHYAKQALRVVLERKEERR